jgi:hypothetical protein
MTRTMLTQPCLARAAAPHPVENRKAMSHSQLKGPNISTHIQRPLKELENSISGVLLSLSDSCCPGRQTRNLMLMAFQMKKEEGQHHTHLEIRNSEVQSLSERGPTAPELTLLVLRRQAQSAYVLNHGAVTSLPLLPPTKRMREDKRDSSGRKIVMVPSSEFLSKFVEWRKSRLESLALNHNFDRWYDSVRGFSKRKYLASVDVEWTCKN